MPGMNGRMWWRGFGLAVALLVAGCGPSDAGLRRLAARGEIERGAAIVAEVRLSIAAPPEVVWRVFTDVDAWPGWFPGVSAARIEGPVASGTRFDWTKRGRRLRSMLVLVDRPRALSWIGRSWAAAAIRVVRLTPLPDGRTMVRESESLDGPLIGWLSAPGATEGNLRVELTALRRRAEAVARHGAP